MRCILSNTLQCEGEIRNGVVRKKIKRLKSRMASTLQETIISPSDRSFFLVRCSSDAQTFTIHEVIHPSFAELFFITGIKSNRAIFDADLEHSTKGR